jgi:hypothetical protein
MGASSIYRHVRSKHELLVLELSELQEEAWLRFRRADDKAQPTRVRVQRFLEVQHELFASDADLVVIALRATTYPEAPVARPRARAQDRAIGLLTEILQSGSARLSRPASTRSAAGRALFHVASGARISWANGCSPRSAAARGRRVGRPLVPRLVRARLEVRVAFDLGLLRGEPSRGTRRPVHAR